MVMESGLSKWVGGPNFIKVPRGGQGKGTHKDKNPMEGKGRPKRMSINSGYGDPKLISKEDKKKYDPNNRPVLTTGQFKPSGKRHT